MVALVDAHVIAWLASGDNATTEQARFVYSSWFDAAAAIKGDRTVEMVALVEGHVIAWLASGDKATRKEARFVYSSWLDAAAAISGDRAIEMVSLVEAHTIAWLASGNNATSEQAGFVYCTWLDALTAIKGDRAVEMVAPVEPYVTAWLASGNATRTEAQFVYKSWLDAAAAIKGDRAVEMVALVEAHVTAWLANGDNATSEHARFVYQGWLEAADELEIRRFSRETITWIEAHYDSDGCNYVLESWLDKHLDFDTIAEPCYRIVCRSFDKPECGYILKHVVRRLELPVHVVFAALCWCARFPEHEDALTRMGPLIRVRWLDPIGAARLTQVAAKVLCCQIADEFVVDPFRLCHSALRWGSLFEIGETFYQAEKLAGFILCGWLRAGHIFRPALFVGGNNACPQFWIRRSHWSEALLTNNDARGIYPRY